MKKEILFGILFLSLVGLVSAGPCNLQVSLLNQDPYPAVPGDYVKLVFQIQGVENPLCGMVSFKLLEKFPIEFDPGTNSEVSINAGTYTRDHSSYLMAPYKVRVNENALDGENPIEAEFSYRSEEGTEAHQTKKFDLNVENVKANFEVFVKDYNSATRMVTFEILNIASNNVEALTVEIPKQDNIEVKGSNINIVGDLDSNEYTSTDFEAILQNGEIQLKIYYTDEIGERRSIEETVLFDASYFQGRVSQQKSTPWLIYLIILVVVFLIIRWWWKRHKKKHHENKK